MSPEPLNLLLVSIAGARADHLSAYGYPRETTPFIDRLAREGVRFANAFTTAPATLAAHASLLTGQHPVAHGATAESRFLPTRQETLAQRLKAAGYRTAAFCTNPLLSPATGFGRGFDAFFTQRYQNRFAARAVSYGRRASDRLLRRKDAGARRTNAALRRWIGDRDGPFFAFVHYAEPRLGQRPPAPHDRLFAEPHRQLRQIDVDPYASLAAQASVDADDVAIVRALYDGALHYVDMRLRELAELLTARGCWERTLLIVIGDHGEALGEHGTLGHKLTMRDALLRVPLVMRCPSVLPQGFVIEDMAQTCDVLPTILELLQLPAPAESLSGRALLQAGRATPGPGFAIAERYRPNIADLRERFPGIDLDALDVRQKTIRTRREKFVWHSDENNEFYDLIADPAEQCNLVETEGECVERLRRQLFDWLASVEKFEWDERPPEIDGNMRAQLRALGYLD